MNKCTFIFILASLLALGGLAQPPEADSIVGLDEHALNTLIESEKAKMAKAFTGSDVEIITIRDAGAISKVERKWNESVPGYFSTGLDGGRADVLARAKEILRGGDEETRYRVFYELRWMYQDAPIWHDPEFPRLLLPFVHNPETRRPALNLLAFCDPDLGISESVKLFQTEKLSADQQIEILYCLRNGPPSNEGLNFFLSLLADKNKFTNEPGLESTLKSLIAEWYRTGTADQKKSAGNAMIQLAESGRLSNVPENRNYILSICNSAGQKDIPLLENMLLEGYHRMEITAALSRLKGTQMQESIVALMKADKLEFISGEAIWWAWQNDPVERKQRLFGYLARTNLMEEKTQLMNFLATHLTETEYREAVAQFTHEFTRVQFLRFYELWYLPMPVNHPIRREAELLFKLGLISKPVPPSVMDSIRAENRQYGSLAYHHNLLYSMPFVIRFDAETGVMPNPYDEILNARVLGQVRDKLPHAWAYQQSEYFEDTETSQEKIYLANGNVMYHATTYSEDDWLDIALITGLLNRMAADAGIAERFVPFDTGGQEAGYIFGDPGRVQILLKVLEMDR